MSKHDDESPGKTGLKADAVQPRARTPKAPAKGSAWDTIKTVFYAVLIAVLVRTVLIEPFSIPSRSMLPTLVVGDYLFVTKFSYGYSKHSLPFSPSLFDGRVFFTEPKRGDVIVFKKPTDNRTDYIKRLIGLPGDRIQVIRGRLHINGKMVPRKLIGTVKNIVWRESFPGGGTIIRRVPRSVTYKHYREFLPNGKAHSIYEISDNEGFKDNTDIYVVPKGHYFMMGDNRDNSQDSRYLGEVGYVPVENLVGRADFIFFSLHERRKWWEIWYWPKFVRFARVFSSVK
ncbi:MAG: signal peptidase I [Alphaproteobacteria bacterium]